MVCQVVFDNEKMNAKMESHLEKNGKLLCLPGWQMLRYRSTGGTRKVRVRTPNIRYFVAKLSIVAIYALFERPPIELSTKVILLWECFQQKSACF